MSYVIKLGSQALAVEAISHVSPLGGDPDPWAAYTFASGDTFRIEQSGSSKYFTADIDSHQWGNMNFSNQSSPNGDFNGAVGDLVSVYDDGGTLKFSGDFGTLLGSAQTFSGGSSYTPVAGDTFTISRAGTGEQFDAVVVSLADGAESWSPRELTVTGTGSIDLGSFGSNISNFDSPILFMRGASQQWSEIPMTFFSMSDANGVLGGQSTMSKKFNSLIGRRDPSDPGLDGGGHRMPEEIKLGQADDELILGSLTVKKDSVSASMFTGQISDIANHDTGDLLEDPNGSDASGTWYFTAVRAQASISADASRASDDADAVNNSGEGGLTYGVSAPGQVQFRSPSRLWLKNQVLDGQTYNTDKAISAGIHTLSELNYVSATGALEHKSVTVSDVWGIFSDDPGNGLTRVDGAYSLAQSIKSDARPTFAGMDLTESLIIGSNGSAKDLTVWGDLTVKGAQLIAEVQTVQVEDNIMHLNKKADGSPAVTPAVSGLRIETAEAFDPGLLYVAGDAKFKLQKMPEGDALDSPLGDLMDLEINDLTASMVTADLTGRITDISEKPDGSRHSTSELDEGSNLYYTDARVHAAVSASKGVQETNGAFEAAIDGSSQLAIQKDSGLKIDFSVDDLEVNPHHGSLSYAGNKLTFQAVTVSDVRGDVSAKADESLQYDGGAGEFSLLLDGSSTILSQGTSGLKASISRIVASPGAPDLTVADGVITYTPPSDANIHARFSHVDAALDAAPADESARVAELSKANGVYTLKSASIAQIFDHLTVASDSDLAGLSNASGSDARVGSLAYDDDGEYSAKFATVAQIRGLFDASTNAESGQMELSYDAATGVFSLDELSPSEVQVHIVPVPDANVTGKIGSTQVDDEQYGSISFQGNAGAKEIILQRVKRSEIQEDFSRSGDAALTYDGAGKYDLTITRAQRVADAFTLVNGKITDASQMIADVEWSGSEVAIRPASVEEMRKIVGINAGSNAALTYDGATGDFSLASDMDFGTVTAAAFCDSDLSESAGELIEVNCLVATDGNKARADRDDWSMLGVAMEEIPSGAAMTSKVEMMGTGAVAELATDDTVSAGDWLYLSDSVAGKVQKAMPTAAGKCVVLVGRAMANSAAGSVKVSCHIQFLFNCDS